MKKKDMIAGTPAEYSKPPLPDNNPAGVLPLPNYDTDPSAGKYGKGHFDFAGLVAKGESPKAPDVNVITANGVSNSKGQDKGRQYNWGDNNLDGEWNNNGPFEGGNLTGM